MAEELLRGNIKQGDTLDVHAADCEMKKPPMNILPNPFPSGIDLLHDPVLNKGTAFNEEERDAFGLRGLLPPRVHSQEEQILRIIENMRAKPSDLERYIFMLGLQDRNERLFYRAVLDHLDEMMGQTGISTVSSKPVKRI